VRLSLPPIEAVFDQFYQFRLFFVGKGYRLCYDDKNRFVVATKQTAGVTLVNIIFIVVDTLRYDHLGTNGNDWIRTPNIDRLAAESWAFDCAFSASFPTIPYRTDVMTGRYGGPFHPWKPLRHDIQTLPWTLSQAGYATQLIHDTPHLVNGGHNFDWPFSGWTFIRGAEVDRPWVTDNLQWPENWCRDPLFEPLGDEGLNRRHIATYARANRNRRKYEDWNCFQLFHTAAEFLKDNANRDNFFLWIDCFDPHEPWDAPVEFMKIYDSDPDYDGRVDPRSLYQDRNSDRLSDQARARIKAQYPAKLTWVDYCLGQLLDAMELTGLSQNTAVVFTGDHGTQVGERRKFGKGLPVRESEGHVPLFIRHPDGDTGRSQIIAQPQDFFATVLGLAEVDVPMPAGVVSHDLLDLARNGASGQRQVALAGGTPQNWRPETEELAPSLFTCFDQEWCLEVTAKSEQAKLTRLGSLDDVADRHPKIVEELHSAALDEIERRGLDPKLVSWLRSGGDRPIPEDCRLWDGYPGPTGFHTYWNRTYIDD